MSGPPRPVVVDDMEITENSRDRDRLPRPSPRGKGSNPPTDDRIRSALDAVAVYVPAEGIGFYVAATALIGAPTLAQDVFVFILTIAIVGVLVVLSHHRTSRSHRSSKRLAQALLFAVFGAALYMSAMPYSFAHTWGPYTPTISGVVVLAAAILMPAIGTILGLTNHAGNYDSDI
jgi:hypothetical protein